MIRTQRHSRFALMSLDEIRATRDIVLQTEETKSNFSGSGKQEAWLNITYNYGKHYRRVFGENGIRTIYGMTGAESIPIIKAAMEKLSDDISEDYWEATEGNAKKALAGLLAFAQMRPDGVWKGD